MNRSDDLSGLQQFLLRQAQAGAPLPEGVVALAPQSSGRWNVPVAGESYYQDAILAGIASAEDVELRDDRTDRDKFFVYAMLVRDPGNAYDQNAIAVFIDGSQVGHVAREEARTYAPLLDARFPRRLLLCDAEDRRPTSRRHPVDRP
jgi:hypothetical protein